MTEGRLSLRSLAKLLGVDDKSVRKAMAAGVFSQQSVRRDASGVPEVVDVTLAVDEWQRSGRQLRGSVRHQVIPASPAGQSAAGLTVVDELPPGDPHAELDALLVRVRTLRERLAPAGPAAGDAAGGPSVPRDDLESSPTLVKAQTDAMIERARKLRMENDLRDGALVEATEAAKTAFEFARTLREAILNVPPRIAAELAAESDASRVHVRLEAALREALTAVATILEQSVPPPAATVEG